MSTVTLGRSTRSGQNRNTTASSTHRSQRSPWYRLGNQSEQRSRDLQTNSQANDHERPDKKHNTTTSLVQSDKRNPSQTHRISNRSEQSPRNFQRENGRKKTDGWPTLNENNTTSLTQQGQVSPWQNYDQDNRSDTSPREFQWDIDKTNHELDNPNHSTEDPQTSWQTFQHDNWSQQSSNSFKKDSRDNQTISSSTSGEQRSPLHNLGSKQSEQDRRIFQQDNALKHEPDLIMSEDAIRKAIELDQVAKAVREQAAHWNRIQARTLGELERMRREMISGMAFSESKTAQAFVDEKNKDLVIALRKTEYRNRQLAEALRECNKYNLQHVELHQRMAKL